MKKRKKQPEFYPRPVELKQETPGCTIRVHLIRPKTLRDIMYPDGLDCGSRLKITHNQEDE